VQFFIYFFGKQKDIIQLSTRGTQTNSKSLSNHTKFKKDIGFNSQSENKTPDLVPPLPQNQSQDKDFVFNKTTLLFVAMPLKIELLIKFNTF